MLRATRCSHHLWISNQPAVLLMVDCSPTTPLFSPPCSSLQPRLAFQPVPACSSLFLQAAPHCSAAPLRSCLLATAPLRPQPAAIHRERRRLTLARDPAIS